MSSRDRILVSVFLMVWLAPSPGHRRLRFSFQINDVKDLNGFCRTHRYARRRRGGASLEARSGSVNRLMNSSRNSGSGHKEHLRAARELPHQSAGESFEGAEDRPATSGKQEVFTLLGSFRRPVALPNREGRHIAGSCSSCKRHRAFIRETGDESTFIRR